MFVPLVGLGDGVRFDEQPEGLGAAGHDDLREAELAIRTLAREIPDDESIHSCLIPEH